MNNKHNLEFISAVMPARDEEVCIPGPVALLLKAIVRGCSFAGIPICWCNHPAGEAKLKIKEAGIRYLLICLYVWLEKCFSGGDYRVGRVQ